jgi:hypothetical protein
MDEKELLMLIGEQTLLSEERQLLLANKNALVAKVLGLYNDINMCHGKPAWLDKGIELLQTTHAAQTKLIELDVRINEIKKLTGR